jgi:hypothetical protein
MNDGERLPVVMWHISCFDRRKQNPLPLETRSFVMDWSQLSVEESRSMLQMLDDRQVYHSPSAPAATVITVTRTPRRQDRRLLRYRKYFCEVPHSELQRMIEEVGAGRLVGVDGDYFEDETGQEISEYEMIQHVSGIEQPIIAGDPESVMRLGPSPRQAKGEWDASSANTIAQFLEVVERICDSRSYRAPQVVAFEVSTNDFSKFPTQGERKLLEACFPNDEETMAVLAYFRQLHAGDKLLEKAAGTYLKHCSEQRKCDWMRDRIEAFKQMVDSAPPPFGIGYTRREVIQLVMYGAGMLHAKSDHGDDAKLQSLVSEQGRESVVSIFNNCLLDLLSVAVVVYRVIRQDFESWLTDHQLAQPDRQRINELFASFRSQMQR